MQRATTVALSVVCFTLLGVATNVASGLLPPVLDPYLWLTWPLLLLLLGVTITVEVRGRGRHRRGSGERASARARRVLLERVRLYWISNVLEQSLYNAARIELGMVAEIDATHYPWEVAVADAGGAAVAFPAGTGMETIFQRLDRAVVVLGEPGAGKTTMLLELARELVTTAERDPDAPIPVVLNLASWATRRRPVAEWIADELVDRYRIPASQAQQWVASGEILPLLDGLDEVAAKHRDACAVAINEFHVQNLLVPLAVCCRSVEYSSLLRRIATYGTVTVQPLTGAQVDAFLVAAGAPLGGLRVALARDSELRRLATSPLLLSIMALAYADATGAEPQPVGSATGSRAALYDHYVRAMLHQRRDARYGPKETVDYLTCLADSLARKEQSVFVLDRLWSAHWLDFPPSDLFARFVGCAAVGVVLGIVGWFALALPGMIAGIAMGAVAALGTTVAYEGLGDIVLQLRDDGPRRRPAFWRLSWVFRTLGELMKEGPPPVGAGLLATGVGVAFGLAAGPASGLAHGVGFAVLGLVSWAVADHISAIETWYRNRPTNDGRREVPSPVLRRRLRVGAAGGALTGLVLGAVAMLAVVWPSGQAAAVRFGGFAAVATAVVIIALTGGIQTVDQWLVRRDLARHGILPYPLAPFLDYAVQCLFLRRVGDGHIFVHRELLDHFHQRLFP